MGPSDTRPQNWPGPHQLVFDEVTDDFVVEVLDRGPADALLYVLLLGATKGAGVGAAGWAKMCALLECVFHVHSRMREESGAVFPHPTSHQLGQSPITKPIVLSGAGWKCQPGSPRPQTGVGQ